MFTSNDVCGIYEQLARIHRDLEDRDASRTKTKNAKKTPKIRKALGSFREALDAGQQELITKVDSLKDEKLTAATKQLNELGMHRVTLQVYKGDY